MSDTNPDAGAEANSQSQLGMQAMLDLAAPQPNYKALIEQGGFVQPMDHIAISFSRANSEFVLRHHELFSSRVEMNLGNVRPLIPLNVDPPQHASYRKLLDPLFSPKRMDEQEADITRRVKRLIDAFIDRRECNFSEEFADLFPTSVFLGLMGLPEDELPMFLVCETVSCIPRSWTPMPALTSTSVWRDERNRPGDLRLLRRPHRAYGSTSRQ